jgi:hypothetical protein
MMAMAGDFFFDPVEDAGLDAGGLEQRFVLNFKFSVRLGRERVGNRGFVTSVCVHGVGLLWGCGGKCQPAGLMTKGKLVDGWRGGEGGWGSKVEQGGKVVDFSDQDFVEQGAVP